jgi:predicted transcriptional regulator
MKSSTMKKVAACFMLLCAVSYMPATNIYLSPAGNDSQDGSLPEKAVATLSRAIALIPTGGSDYVINPP